MDYRYRFTILGRYPARLKENETALTVNVLAGRADHLTYAGTFTMTEGEWTNFVDGLRRGLGENIEIDDHRLR